MNELLTTPQNNLDWADDDMMFLDMTPEEEAHAREIEMRESFIQNSANEPEAQAALEGWFAALPVEEQAALTAERQTQQDLLKVRAEQFERVRGELNRTAPELLQGTLPADLVEKLGTDTYFLGSNQTIASSAQEAADYLAQTGGIELGGYDLSGRAYWFDNSTDKSFVDHAVVEGYLGDPDVGRFIIALPHEQLSDAYSIDMAMKNMRADGEMPEDFVVSRHGETVINQKYCAGFIDSAGAFYENPQFMQEVSVVTPDQEDFL